MKWVRWRDVPLKCYNNFMKKVIYVVWLLLALASGFVIAALNSTLLVLPFVFGGMGISTVVILLAVFIIALYKVWVGRGIWSTTETHEKNI
jgi:hypothetical protein